MGLRPFVNGRASVLASRSCIDSNMGRIMSTFAFPGRFLWGQVPLEILVYLHDRRTPLCAKR